MIYSPNITSPPVQQLAHGILSGKPVQRVTSLKGSFPGFLAGLLLRETGRSMLIVCPTAEDSERLFTEIGFFAGSLARMLLYPALDVYQPIVSDPRNSRTIALSQLFDTRGVSTVVVAPALALFQRTIHPDDLIDHVSEVRQGHDLDRDSFGHMLVRGGYSAVGSVMEIGDFSVRGGIIDVFPPGQSQPVRIELFGDEVESLRLFDPDSQRSLRQVERILVPPVKEVIVTNSSAYRAQKRLEQLAQSLKEGRFNLPESVSFIDAYRQLLTRIQLKTHFPGIEHFIGWYSEHRATLMDYIEDDWLVLVLEPYDMDDHLSRRGDEITSAWIQVATSGGLLPPPGDIFVERENVQREIMSRQRVIMGQPPMPTAAIKADNPALFPDLAIGTLEADNVEPILIPTLDNADILMDPARGDPLLHLTEHLKFWEEAQERVVIVSPSPGKAERMAEMLADHEITLSGVHKPEQLILDPDLPQHGSVIGPIRRGFQYPAAKLVVVTEEEIFGEKIRRGRRQKRLDFYPGDLSDLEVGDSIVHVDHGIGKYLGLISLEVQWIGDWDFVNLRERPRIRMDCLHLEYAEGNKLYLPVDKLGLIQKYRGAEEGTPALDRLGGTSWEKVKRRVSQAIREMAEELISLQAARAVFQGTSYSAPDHVFREFEATFPYEETPDQLEAIEQVLGDMHEPRPMDRLVCGDVGYGKTEVAIRAAFIAAMDARQVAVLVPTTILAQQHYETFSRRLKPYPVRVDLLSRFRTPAQIKKTLEGLEKGNIDIVIGTHRLLSKDVKFRDLGLLVIDEEQRFGVRHKEKLKKLKQTVDVLTLTATPIPRTLHMSLSGVRDLSIINTAPPDRLAVHTELQTFDENLIRQAVLRELRRSGQVFFVHNRVQTIEATAARLRELLPEVSIAVAHGQMAERDLERVMHDFVNRKYDMLVCSAIIESGLDIPTVNTMIINRADQFGLAQLYQLRGRIGRSKERGYAYLLIPGKGLITPDAAKRLKVLKEFTELGSGFKIAAHDLEIRGAGNILGTAQSGNVALIGFELYMQMLDEAVRRLKGETVEPAIEPEIKLPVPAYIPEEYVPADNQRLVWYKRLSQIRDAEDAAGLREEMLDRNGTRPEPVENLFEVMTIKALLKKLRAKGLEYNGKALVLDLGEQAKIDPDLLVEKITREPKKFRLTPDHKFHLFISPRDPQSLFQDTRRFLNSLL